MRCAAVARGAAGFAHLQRAGFCARKFVRVHVSGTRARRAAQRTTVVSGRFWECVSLVSCFLFAHFVFFLFFVRLIYFMCMLLYSDVFMIVAFVCLFVCSQIHNLTNVELLVCHSCSYSALHLILLFILVLLLSRLAGLAIVFK